MFLRHFLLLVMLIIKLGSEPYRTIEPCGSSMVCFTPDTCGMGLSRKLIQEIGNLPVKFGCEIVVKIRSYNDNHILIILESLKDDVDWIILKQDNKDFECVKDGMKFKARYAGVEQTLINKIDNTQILVCEFYVKQESEIFKESIENVKLTHSKLQTGDIFTLKDQLFRSYITPTCDPAVVKVEIPDEGKLFTAFEAKLENLNCPIGYKRMFRVNSASKFTEASEIICKMEGIVYRYEAMPVTPHSTPIPLDSSSSAHCETTICTMCDNSITPTGIDNLSIKTEQDGCKKLQCDNGRRIKIGESLAIDGTAECKYEQESVWKFNDKTIKKDSKITCVEKKKCDETEAKKWCPDCIPVGENNLPKCKHNASLKFLTSEVEVFCNDINGELYFRVKGEKIDRTFDHLKEDTLHCEDKSNSSPQVDSASFDPKIIGYIVAPLIVIALIGVGVYFGMKQMKKRQNKEQLPPTVTDNMKEGTIKSKESIKSSLESRRNDEVKSKEIKSKESIKTSLELRKMDEAKRIVEEVRKAKEARKIEEYNKEKVMIGIELEKALNNPDQELVMDDNAGIMDTGGNIIHLVESGTRKSNDGKGTRKNDKEPAAERNDNAGDHNTFPHIPRPHSGRQN